MRIVSLLPSATEIVCALGLEDRLVGVTHSCDYPPAVARLPVVTRSLVPSDAASGEIDALARDRLATRRSLYALDRALLAELRPDLVITQALCEICAVADEEVREAAAELPGSPEVVSLTPHSLAGVFASIREVGRATGRDQLACHLVAGLERRVEAVAARSASVAYRPRVVLLEWIDPPFACGHWSPELVDLAGGTEGLGRAGHPSRTARWEEIVAWQPEVLVLACCGFDIERTRRDLPILRGYPGFDRLPCVQSDRVFALDGAAFFSRPGPRLVESLELLGHILHPDLHPLPPGLSAEPLSLSS